MQHESQSLERARFEAVREMVEAVVRIRSEGGQPYTSGVGARMMTRSSLADLGFERFTDFVGWAQDRGFVRGLIDHGPGKLEIDLTEEGLELLPESAKQLLPRDWSGRPGAGAAVRAADGSVRGGSAHGLIKQPARERFVPLRRDLWHAFVYSGSVPRRFFYDREQDAVLGFSPQRRPLEADEEGRARQLVERTRGTDRFVEIVPIDRERQLRWLEEWEPDSRGLRLQREGLLHDRRPFDAFLAFIRDPDGQDLRWAWNRYRSTRVIQAAEEWRRHNQLEADIFEASIQTPHDDGVHAARAALHALVEDLDDETLQELAQRLRHPDAEA